MANGEGGAPLAIALLGPLRVEVGGAEVPVSAARERAVLARLAIDAGKSVADHELIASVWGNDPPASARATLQTYISHLRRVIGAEAIARDSRGYRLCGADVDVQTFTETMHAARANGDPAGRVADLQRALGLWRGTPLDDLDDDSSLAVRVGLEEDRVLATEQLLEARLAAEPAAQVVPALEQLCMRHPLREHAARLLMTALYRAGRQADALGAYRRLRAALVDELGLEPAPALRELEQRILQHDASLEEPAATTAPAPRPAADPPPPATMPLPPRLVTGRATGPFVGRRAELFRLLAALDATEADGNARAVVLRGEAGIGKTRLARELALAAAGRGWLVTWGRCPADAASAFHPIAEALDQLVQWRPELAGGHEHLLASVLPALAPRMSDPLAILRAGATQRFALLEALTHLTAGAADIAPVLIVVDDLHWADAGTAAFLEHLAARRSLRVLVLATSRSPEPTESEHITHLLERMRRDHDLTTVDVGGLSETEVRAMVDRTTAAPAPTDAVSALHTKTGGNPFFVGEVLAALGDDGVLVLDGHLPLTAGVQAVLAQRIDHLSADEQDVLAAAAAIGADFDLSSCTACTDLSQRDVLRALDRAASMALVEEGATPGSYSFRHALVQAAVWTRSPRARRAELEERAASLDAARTMAEPGALGRRVANRLLADAAPATDRPRSLDDRDPLLAASRATLLRIAAGVTPLLSSPGIEAVVASDLTDERAGRTVLRWARSMHQRGDTALALARAVECAELARQLPSPALLVEAALVGAECAGLLPGLAHPEVSGDVRRLVADAYQVSATLDGHDAQHAQLSVHLANAGGEPANQAMLAVAAGRAARRAGSPRWEAEALLTVRNTTWGGTSAGERLTHASTALDLATELPDDDVRARALAMMARDLTALGRIEEAAVHLQRLVVLPGLRPAQRGSARLQQAALALATGDATAAAETIEWAAAGGHLRSADDPYDPLATLLLVLAVQQGQLAEARSSLREAVDRWPTSVLWIGALAAAETEAGDVSATTERLRAATTLVERGSSSAGDIAGMLLLQRAAAKHGHPLDGMLRRHLAAHRNELAIAGEVGVLGRVGDLIA